jgi:hypothetical protein
MTEKDMLLRDIETLRESLSLAMKEAAIKALTDEDRRDLSKYVSWLVRELQELIGRLGIIEQNIS